MRINDYKAPISVCWDITSRCNENCEFCYRVELSNELPLIENLKILQKLIQAGVKKISWVGGEPLLYQGLFDLMSEAHSAGIVTSITTNGLLLDKETLETLDGILDWLTLPLDGSNPDIQHNMTRNKNHFDHILYILDLINRNEFSFKVKINTIATKLNKHDIVNLIPIIKKYKVKRWKIFQFFPIRGNAQRNRYKFEISENEFSEIKKIINSKRHLINDCMITFSDIKDLQRSYFSISPNGVVRISNAKKDIPVGNLREQDVHEIWKNNLFDKVRHAERNRWLIEKSNFAQQESIRPRFTSSSKFGLC